MHSCAHACARTNSHDRGLGLLRPSEMMAHLLAATIIYDKHGVLDILVKALSDAIAEAHIRWSCTAATCSYGVGRISAYFAGCDGRGHDWSSIRAIGVSHVFTTVKGHRDPDFASQNFRSWVRDCGGRIEDMTKGPAIRRMLRGLCADGVLGADPMVLFLDDDYRNLLDVVAALGGQIVEPARVQRPCRVAQCVRITRAADILV